MEDGHRLGIVLREEIVSLFIDVELCKPAGRKLGEVFEYYNDIEDKNESIAFLRAKVINVLTLESVAIFLKNQHSILSGSYNDTLLGSIERKCDPLKMIGQLSLEKIYRHDTVMQIEIAGYNVLSELLQLFIPALLTKNPSHKQRMVLKLFPYQFTEFMETESGYLKVMSALDFISGMTDTYATEMYRRLKGIVIPQHR